MGIQKNHIKHLIYSNLCVMKKYNSFGVITLMLHKIQSCYYRIKRIKVSFNEFHFIKANKTLK